MYDLIWVLGNTKNFLKFFKHTEIIKEFLYTCCIAYAIAYAGGCCSISQSTSYIAITGGGK